MSAGNTYPLIIVHLSFTPYWPDEYCRREFKISKTTGHLMQVQLR